MLSAPSARADDVELPARLSVIALGGYGASVSHTDLPNIYGAAVGIRGGYTWSNGTYIGGMYSEHSGYSLSPDAPASGLAVPTRGSRTIVGGELGHDWELTLIYRIYFGAGVILDHGVDRDTTGKYVPIFSEPGFVAWPGVMVLYPFRQLVLGVDFHLTIPGLSEAAVGIEGSLVVGTRFSL